MNWFRARYLIVAAIAFIGFWLLRLGTDSVLDVGGQFLALIAGFALFVAAALVLFRRPQAASGAILKAPCGRRVVPSGGEGSRLTGSSVSATPGSLPPRNDTRSFVGTTRVLHAAGELGEQTFARFTSCDPRSAPRLFDASLCFNRE